MKKEKGITLIALVITIIVLLILAAVTINLTLGERGIFNTAQLAAKNYTDASQKELASLADFESEINTVVQSEKTNGSYSVARKVNSPKLNNTGLTAVRIANNGTLTNADTTKEDWYSYDGTTNEWANAKTKDGSMWVWIPRYAYKITYNDASDKSKGGTIDVVFLQGTSKLDANGKDVTNENYVDEKGKTGAYIVHPAFQDGRSNGFANGEWRKEIEGFWMAKFEAGKTKTKYPTFQANKPSDGRNIADAYDLCMDMNKNGNTYGLSSNSNSHLTKNSEWGAVAYLAHSKYGRNGKEITINNVTLGGVNGLYAVTGYGSTTGISAGSVSITYENIGKQDGSWTTASGKSASTTNNLYGIYDLSGGAWEWTAGYVIARGEIDYYEKYGGNLKGESNEYKSKYAGTSTKAQENLENSDNIERKGEAIWETSSEVEGRTEWNGDWLYFVHDKGPFTVRGGSDGETTAGGVFALSRNGGAYIIGFRAVLVVE